MAFPQTFRRKICVKKNSRRSCGKFALMSLPQNGPSTREGRTTKSREALDRRRRIAAWVAREVMPHEARVRAWLGRRGMAREDIDDVIQESYCILAAIDRFEEIARPDGYFFQTARHLVRRRAARAKVVPFVPLLDDDHLDDQPDPERDAAGRLALARVLLLLEKLPERRRLVLRLNRVEGLSQRHIAEKLGLSENVVDHEMRFGLADLKQAWDAACQTEGEAVAALRSIGRLA